MKDWPASNTVPALLLLILTCGIFWPGLSGGFVFDDFPNIVTNARIHAEDLSFETMRTAARAYEPGSWGRPLATIGFAIDYLISGKDPIAFKVHSLLVHLLNTLLVFALCLRLLPLAFPQASEPLAARLRQAAFWMAVVWAVHPLQASSVLYVVQRMETLAVTFLLLALLCYLRGRRDQVDGRFGWGWLFASGGLAGVGLLAKETGVVFPLLAWMLELTVLGFRAHNPSTTRLLKGLYLVGLILGVAGFAMFSARYLGPDVYALRDFSAGERVLTQFRALGLYLQQILLPLPSSMTFYYDNYPPSRGLLTPASTLVCAVLLVALLAAAAWWRRRLPLFALGIFWFFSAHVLTSGVIPLELVFEHRNYFALLSVLLAITGLIGGTTQFQPGRVLRTSVVIGLVTVAVLGAFRATTWGSQLRLAEDLAARNPGSPRASSELATTYFGIAGNDPDSHAWALAIREFERGAALPNSSPLPEQGLILMTASVDGEVKPAWWDSLIEKLGRMPISPQEVMTVTGLVGQRIAGFALDDRRLAEAYLTLVRRSTPPAGAYALFADHSLRFLGDTSQAQSLFIRSIEQAKHDPAFVARVVQGLATDGQLEIARAVRARAIELGILDAADHDIAEPDQSDPPEQPDPTPISQRL